MRSFSVYGNNFDNMARRVEGQVEDTKYLKGMLPDIEDKRNIQRLIEQYEAAFPGQLAWCIKQSRKEVSQQRKLQAVAEAANKPAFNRRLSMPQPFLLELKKAYPMILVDRRQFEWFLKNFPQFDLSK